MYGCNRLFTGEKTLNEDMKLKVTQLEYVSECNETQPDGNESS